MKYFERVSGSISVFLVLVMFPLYSCVYLAIDSVRRSSARSKMTGAMNLTGNAALNSYEKAMKDRYGLFVMGTDEAQLEREMQAVFSNTVDGVSDGFENMIGTSPREFTLRYDSGSSLASPDVLEPMVTDYMKYRAPYSFAYGVSQRLGFIKQAPEAAEVMEKSGGYYQSMESVNKVVTDLSGTVSNEDSSDKEEIKSLLSGLKKLRKESKDVEKEAEKWKQALGRMEDGEAKSLLSADYKNSAGVFSGDSINTLERKLKEDLETIAEAEKEEGEPEQTEGHTEEKAEPVLQYEDDPLYLVLRSAAGSAATEEESTAAEEKKDSLTTLSKTDTDRYISGLKKVSVSELLGDAGSAIDGKGSLAAAETEEIAQGNNKSEILKNTKSFLDILTSRKDSLLSDCYVEEYINSAFSCYTNKETDNSVTGVTLGNMPLFGEETEYILFGKDDAARNVTLCKDLIFSLRFLFNSIYVFSNAKMRSEAMSAAAAVSAWTGAGVILVQNLILTAWAMAESVMDTASLMKGEKIPLYKNAATWTLSINGVTGKLKEGAENYASKAIDDVFDQLQTTADDKIDELGASAANYFDQSLEGAAESLTNMIMAPIESRITLLIGEKAGSAKIGSEQDISEMVMKAVEEADNGTKGYKAARALFEEYALEPLSSELYGDYQQLLNADDTISKQAAEQMENALTDEYSVLLEKVEQMIGEFTDEAKSGIGSALDSANEKGKESALKVIDKYTGKLSELLGNTDSPETSSVSSSSALAMSYRDYLKIFTVVGLSRKETKKGMLTRCAKVMQINCSQSSDGFNVVDCFTKVTLHAVVGIASYKLEESESYAYL